MTFGDADALDGNLQGSRHQDEHAFVGHIGFGLLAYRQLIVVAGYFLDALILGPRLDPHFDMHPVC